MAGASRLPALANVFQYTADPSWRAVDFISDLHLSEATPRTYALFSRYLRQTPADAVFILGDLFEVWIGDDARQPGSFAQRAADVLREAAGVRTVLFMAGNRDFLVGGQMLRDCGVVPLPDPTSLEACGLRLLLTHGDALCLDDAAYQAFRAQVRTESWRRDFLAKPLAQREQLARAMRDASERLKAGKPVADWADVDAAAAVAWMHAAGSSALIHGHTHRPGTEELAPGRVRWVLSDWDGDAVPERAQVLRLTREGLARLDLPAGV